MRNILAAATTAVAVLALAATAAATDTRSTQAIQLRHAQNVVAFFDNHSWLLAPKHQKCSMVPWQRSCRTARKLSSFYSARVPILQRQMWYVIPSTNDWRTAVRIAQRAYPGTESWMLYISHREGGYGPWVWYGGRRWAGYHIGNDYLGADTVGGWMQFRFSTFAPYWRGAEKDLQQRGFQLPRIPDRGGAAEYQPWLDPLGQALTAGYMRYYGKDACHWCI